MTIELTCKHCGRPFRPEKRDFVRGPQHYYYCSEFCRLTARKRADNPVGRLLVERTLTAWRS